MIMHFLTRTKSIITLKHLQMFSPPGGQDSGGDSRGAKDDGSQLWDGAAHPPTWPAAETGPAGEVSPRPEVIRCTFLCGHFD